MSTKTIQSATQKIPKLRFPGFFGGWEEKKLGDIFIEIKSGKDEPEIKGEYPIYGSTGKIGNSNNYTYSGKYILIARVGANAGKINSAQGKFGVTDNTLVLEGEAGSNTDFFYSLLESKKLNKLVFGSGQPLITGGHLKKLKVIIPSTKEEQQKIAGFLGVVDEWIENLKKQKESFEFYKKGLMQKIFSQEFRFKDGKGKNFPKWEEKKLGEIAEVIGGGTPDTTKDEFWNGEINWFTPTEIKQKYSKGSLRKISQAGLADSSAKLLPVGTILFTSRATVGDVSISTEECATNQGFQSFVANDKAFNIFLYYWVLQNKNEFLRRANGSTFLEISGTEMRKIKSFFPSLLEQQKIAEFLTSVDNIIESKQQQITQAEQWKKGLMQGLFV